MWGWLIWFPELLFSGGFQEDVWGIYFKENRGHAYFWQGIAVIAVLLAALGLYGLVRLNVSGRVREFSIRKVLGARLDHIATIITRQYLLLFTIALALGAPVSYLLVKALFNNAYRYHMPITFWGATIAVFILMGVLGVIVSSQVGQVAKSSPVEGLKVE